MTRYQKSVPLVVVCLLLLLAGQGAAAGLASQPTTGNGTQFLSQSGIPLRAGSHRWIMAPVALGNTGAAIGIPNPHRLSRQAAASVFVYLPFIAKARAPTIASFSASPASIASGAASTLRWSVSGADSLSISPGVGPVSGSSATVRPATSTEYTLTATNAGGSTKAKAILIVTGGQNQGTLFLPASQPTIGSSVAIDAANGIHVAYKALNGDVQYAFCAANCARASNWTVTTVGSADIFGDYTRLALDPQGRPRMMWYRASASGSTEEFVYASCDQGCTSAAHWTLLPITSASSSPETTSNYFALDPQGRPRFVYDDIFNHTTAGTFYAYCNAACTSSANWFETRLTDSTSLFAYSLAFAPTGRLGMVYETGDKLAYFQCDTNCNNSANWIGDITAFDLGSGYDVILQLDSQGRPRVAIYSGYLSTGPSRRLYYAWCNSACAAAANWGRHNLGLPEYSGQDVDMVLDRQNHPRLAYSGDVFNDKLTYAWCTANCESTSPSWQTRVVETTGFLEASNPLPVQPGCSVSAWGNVGPYPSVALDVGGNPRISYDTTHLQGGTCPVHADLYLVRFALFNQP
jgi:hypothetical protein